MLPIRRKSRADTGNDSWHDSPGLYAVHTALNILPFDKIHALRRLDGLPGHPDVGTPGAYTNTGSLGMGVAKAKGFLFADDLMERPAARVYVLTGDGELQEGQFWESPSWTRSIRFSSAVLPGMKVSASAVAIT